MFPNYKLNLPTCVVYLIFSKGHRYCHFCYQYTDSMSVLVRKVDPCSREQSWTALDEEEDYDCQQNIARSTYADMLHDTERNKKYFIALKLAVKKQKDLGKKANVLDIGTGTGLLSMMAAQCGADSIVACEAFRPIAECARIVITQNNFKDCIKVIEKRSTDLTVGPNGDLTEKANILVTEVFDTELIGEGAYATFSHAHKELLEPGCIVVPSCGTVYAQVIESEFVQRWNKVSPMRLDENKVLSVPEFISNCTGTAAVHDLQLSQLSESTFKTIIPPQPVFSFDFSGRTPLIRDRSQMKLSTAINSGTSHAVFMWWDLNMDEEGCVILSCAPHWARPDSHKTLPWRDHWMQAIYYLPHPLHVSLGQQLYLFACHDEFSLWFSLSEHLPHSDALLKSPVCECGLHMMCSRTRIGAINDPVRRNLYVSALNRRLPGDIVLCYGNIPFIAIASALLGASKVYCVCENNVAQRVMKSLVIHNQLESKVVILPDYNLGDIAHNITLVVCEWPLLNSVVPNDELEKWFHVKKLCLSADFIPEQASLCYMPLQFDHLYKIRCPLVTVEGFKMDAFDLLTEKSRNACDAYIEPQPLWEYSNIALAKPVVIIQLGKTKLHEDNTKIFCSTQQLESGICHGVAIWINWHFDDENILSTGPIDTVTPGKRVTWDMHTRQGVHFFPSYTPVKPSYYMSSNVNIMKSKFDVKFQLCEL